MEQLNNEKQSVEVQAVQPTMNQEVQTIELSDSSSSSSTLSKLLNNQTHPNDYTEPAGVTVKSES